MKESSKSLSSRRVVSLWFACPGYFLGEASDFDFVIRGDILLVWLPLPRGRN